MSYFETRVETVRVPGIQNQTIAGSNRVRPALREAAANENARTDESTSGCRALILVSPVQTNAPTPSLARHPANFLAHLIATNQALPQTRERRRIEPSVAVAAYAAARVQGSASASHAFSHAA